DAFALPPDAAHLLVPYPSVHGRIAERLRTARAHRAFLDWLDRERAASVRLAPGYEHPGDPAQPDHEHRH
ncbi:MAG TPA: hypothetical protein VJT31_22925, partial [Rugosimonospora sp.]|nr:hypothetical protein [Rugosimonospora sp.]